MTDKNDGGTGFPLELLCAPNSVIYPGMVLRDWFAGQAVIGLMSHLDVRTQLIDEKKVAEAAYQIADAMLEERGK